MNYKNLTKIIALKLLKDRADNVFYGTLNLFLKKFSVKKNRKLIAHFAHHKCGTTWFHNSLNKIAKRFGLKYQRCTQKHLRNDTDVWLEWHSKVDFDILKPSVGSHMIRDPRDIIISAYFYHLWCDEKWCKIKKREYNNMSYQEYLNSVSQEDGILIEMTNNLEDGNTSGSIIEDIARWNYFNPNIIELKYEKVINDQNTWFTMIFKKYGFNEKEIKTALKIVDKYSFQKRAKRDLGVEKRKSHFRKGTSGDWKNYFKELHKSEFKNQYGDILIKLGYEKDNNW